MYNCDVGYFLTHKKQDFLNQITVYEYDTLQLGAHLNTAQLNALAQFNARHGGKYFQLLHQSIRFKNYVGAIQVGDLEIEILPKIDKGQKAAPFRAVLIHLLQTCNYLKIDKLGKTKLQLVQMSILTLYYEAFLQAVEDLLQQGLSRNYEQTIEEHAVLRGQIHFAKQLSLHWRKSPKFVSKQTRYSYKTLQHQLLYAALKQLRQRNLGADILNRAKKLLQDFPQQEELIVHAQHFENLHYDRKRLHYQNAINLARLLLLGYQPQLKFGTSAVFGILFDMNRLYEDYVYFMLEKALGAEATLERQPTSRFWGTTHLQPDILLKIGADCIVLDTKWKILKTPKPDEHDLRQIYVYQQYFNAIEGWLLYPSINWKPSVAKPFLDSSLVESGGTARILWLNLLKENGQLNDLLGEELLALARRVLHRH